MSPLAISVVISVACFVGALLGILVHHRLPDHHLDADSRGVVTNVMGLLATISALVLGLLIANAQANYNTLSDEIDQLAASMVELDGVLREYGPETAEARVLFKQALAREIERIWPGGEANADALAPGGNAPQLRAFERIVMKLGPTTEAQKLLQRRMLEIASASSRTRMLISNQVGSGLPTPFLVVLSFWLVMLFFGFGMFARSNITVVGALFVGAISVGGAMCLILELCRPFDGMMRVSDGSMRAALGLIGQ